MKRSLVLAAAVVVLVANAWVVVSALRNRGDAPGGTVELTERELQLQPVSKDSSAVFLALRWGVTSNEPEDDGAPGWLNTAKLQELGFNCRVPVESPHAAEHYDATPPKLLHVVLEFDGEAARQAERRQRSRLWAVDVGHDPLQLRAKYPDATRHVICQGVVKPFLKQRTGRDQRPLPQPRLSARIQALLPDEIFLPPPHSKLLQGLHPLPESPKERDNAEPRYAVTVSWGTRYEPWVRSLRLLPNAPESK